ncbi:hypothetical protein AVEN_160630-1 [Araneus ventricosus]|uniref:Uncharacterized protein n=1 Tax=Araneus ventricosus TaxID=182803 RepID=A0A4Y2SKZ5_ARAVE|nr:hypothetical protein AVEN_160630-1 [Araneus ventricosus]
MAVLHLLYSSIKSNRLKVIFTATLRSENDIYATTIRSSIMLDDLRTSNVYYVAERSRSNLISDSVMYTNLVSLPYCDVTQISPSSSDSAVIREENTSEINYVMEWISENLHSTEIRSNGC